MTPAEISLAKSGDTLSFRYSEADIADTYVYEAGNWAPYLADGGVSVTDTVRPMDDSEGASVAGSITFSVTLFHLDTFTSSHVEWEGTGVTVEYTLGNDVWLPLTEDGVIDLSGDPDFDIRVNFAGGVQDDPAELVRLSVYVLKTNTLRSSFNRRPITMSSFPLSDEGGVISGGAYLDIAPNAATPPLTTKTVEFWARSDSATKNMVFFEENGSNRVRINANACTWTSAVFSLEFDGVAKTSGFTVPAGGWHHYKLIFLTATNNPIRIGARATGADPADMTISHLAMYDYVPVNTYNGPAVVRVDDAGGPTVTEDTPAVDIYAYTWSIVSGTQV